MNRVKNQINFNSVLLLLLGALLTFGIKKLDDNNTELIKVSNSMGHLVKRIEGLELKMDEVVMKSDFQSEIGGLRRELDALKRRKP